MNKENEVLTLYLDDIIPNRFQPREVFDDRALQELAASIKEHGVIQPIIVRQIGDKYEIIAGERRYKASALAGLTTIPAIIRNLDDKESSKVALLENLQRRDLSPIEEARTYQKILELDQLTQEELARTMGKSQSAIANKLRLLTLPDEVQDALLNEKISERHARSLLNLTDSKMQIDELNKVIETKMTVRELDAEVKQLQEDASSSESPNKTPRFINIEEKADYSAIPTTTVPVDLNSMRRKAQDIIPKEKPMADLDTLLNIKSANNSSNEISKKEPSNKYIADEQSNVNLDIPPLVDGIPSTKPSFFSIPNPVMPNEPEKLPPEDKINNEQKLIIPSLLDSILDKRGEDIETLDFDLDFPSFKNLTADSPNSLNLASPSSTIKVGKEEAPTKIKLAIEKTRSFVKELEQLGFMVDIEEFDLEKAYQINLKIEK